MQSKMAEKKQIQKRAFYDVEAPLTATKIQLYGSSAEALDGKVITLDLTRSLRGKSLELKMRVRFDGKKLLAEPVRLTLMGSYIRRAIRKGTDYVEDSFSVNCKDGLLLVKPYLITRHKVHRALRRALRVAARKFLTGHCTTRNIKELFGELMANKIQKELSLKLKKIYPLALCEIRWFEVVGKQG